MRLVVTKVMKKSTFVREGKTELCKMGNSTLQKGLKDIFLNIPLPNSQAK